MGENKTPADLIASVRDGRLYKQLESMKDAAIRFILIEGEWSHDGGHTVAEAPHSWMWDQFDNLLASIQAEGVVVLHSPSEKYTARRLAAFYEYTGKEEHGSWKNLERAKPKASRSKLFDAQVAMLMSLPGCGQKKAEGLVKEYGLTDSLGITDLDMAVSRWRAMKGIGPKLSEKWRSFLEGMADG